MRKILLYTLMTLAAAGMASCEDFLTRDTYDQIGSDEFWKSETDLELYANGFIQKMIPGDGTITRGDIYADYCAVDIATDALDRLHTTANSHSRILLCEIMGNKAGWLTLNAGIAGGADIILIPEIPYDIDKICKSVTKRSESGKNFSIIAVAEGCFDQDEAKLKKKERARRRAEAGITTATNRIAAQIQQKTGLEARVCVPGHMLRGGSPSAYDRILATQFGVYAAELIRKGQYGMTVAKVGGAITANKLEDIAGKTKFVLPDDQLVTTARNLGISFGD